MPPWHFSSIQASVEEEEGVNGEMGLEKCSQMLNCSRRIIQNYNLTATRKSSSPLLTVLTTLVNSCDPHVLHFEERRISWHCQGPEGTTRPAGPAQPPLGSPPAPARNPGPHFSSAWHCQSMPQRQEYQSPARLPVLPLAWASNLHCRQLPGQAPREHAIACLRFCLCLCPGEGPREEDV